MNHHFKETSAIADTDLTMEPCTITVVKRVGRKCKIAAKGKQIVKATFNNTGNQW